MNLVTKKADGRLRNSVSKPTKKKENSIHHRYVEKGHQKGNVVITVEHNAHVGDLVMEDVKIILSGLWVALMLVYLWGDVLRIYAGDFKAGEIMGQKPTQRVWLGLAIFMLLPIVMILLSLTLEYDVNRWTNIIAAGFLFVFNLLGLPTYPSAYDKFLIIVGLVINVVTIWYAWVWV
ncbi:MAG: DUF6326 family protein [Candidatus Thorarchaeota archaeon]|jgi:hypothetical protein